jgi:hypothetical protein
MYAFGMHGRHYKDDGQTTLAAGAVLAAVLPDAPHWLKLAAAAVAVSILVADVIRRWT